MELDIQECDCINSQIQTMYYASELKIRSLELTGKNRSQHNDAKEMHCVSWR